MRPSKRHHHRLCDCCDGDDDDDDAMYDDGVVFAVPVVNGQPVMNDFVREIVVPVVRHESALMTSAL